MRSVARLEATAAQRRREQSRVWSKNMKTAVINNYDKFFGRDAVLKRLYNEWSIFHSEFVAMVGVILIVLP